MKAKLAVRDLVPDLWPALEQLFGLRGACGGCWCMYWRLGKGERWEDLKGAPAKRRFKALVASGRAQGAIALAGDEPVGWIAFGPRQDFPRLARARTLACQDAGDIWALPCFYIKPGQRLPNAFAWTGGRGLFERAGFELVGPGETSKVRMRRRP